MALHDAHTYQLVETNCGGIAQLGERLLCKQEVIGSIPFASTNENSLKSICKSSVFHV